MRRPVARLLVVAVTASVLAACGGGDTADLDAYCELVRQGSGVGESDPATQADELDRLLAVAPEEIRDAVQQLRNTTRDLGEIDDLDQLFEAAFDPDAQASRTAFVAFAVQSCGIDEDALPDGRVGSTTDLLDDVRTYVDANFGGEAWVPKVRFDVERANGALDGLTVTFVIAAADGEPIQACNAAAVYLYSLREGAGEVSVVDDGLTVARRLGPEETCTEV